MKKSLQTNNNETENDGNFVAIVLEEVNSFSTYFEGESIFEPIVTIFGIIFFIAYASRKIREDLITRKNEKQEKKKEQSDD